MAEMECGPSSEGPHGPLACLDSCSVEEGLTPQSSGTLQARPAFRVLCPHVSSPHILWPSQGRPGALTVGLCGSWSPLASLIPAGPCFGHTTVGSNPLSPTLEALAYTWSPPALSLGLLYHHLLGSFWVLWPCQLKNNMDTQLVSKKRETLSPACC